MLPSVIISSMIYLNIYVRPSITFDEKAEHLFDYILGIPVGWLLHLIFFIGWPSIVALGLALYEKNLKYLIVSAIISIAWGFVWPPLGQYIASF